MNKPKDSGVTGIILNGGMLDRSNYLGSSPINLLYPRKHCVALIHVRGDLYKLCSKWAVKDQFFCTAHEDKRAGALYF